MGYQHDNVYGTARFDNTASVRHRYTFLLSLQNDNVEDFLYNRRTQGKPLLYVCFLSHTGNILFRTTKSEVPHKLKAAVKSHWKYHSLTSHIACSEELYKYPISTTYNDLDVASAQKLIKGYVRTEPFTSTHVALKDELSFIQCLQPNHSSTSSNRARKLQLMQDLAEQQGHQLQRQDMILDSDTDRKFTNCNDLLAALVKFTVILLSPAHDFADTTSLLIIHLTYLLQWWDGFQNTVAPLSQARNTAVAVQIAEIFMSTSGRVYALGREICDNLDFQARPSTINSPQTLMKFGTILQRLNNGLTSIEHKVANNQGVVPAALSTFVEQPHPDRVPATTIKATTRNLPTPPRNATAVPPTTLKKAQRQIITVTANRNPELAKSARLLFTRARRNAFETLGSPQPCIRFIFGGCATPTCQNSHKEYSQFSAAERAAMQTLKNNAPNEYVFSL